MTAILSPMLIDENPDIVTMECLILDELQVPILNNSDEEFYLQKGMEVGLVEPEDQNISDNKITDLSHADLTEKQKAEVVELCSKYPDVFTETMKMGKTVPGVLAHLLYGVRRTLNL